MRSAETFSLTACPRAQQPWHFPCTSIHATESVPSRGSVDRGLFFGGFPFVVILQTLQPSPPLILFFLGGVGIFVSLQPEAKPIHGSTLRRHAYGGISENVLVRFQHNQVHGLLQITKSGIRLPHTEQAGGAFCNN